MKRLFVLATLVLSFIQVPVASDTVRQPLGQGPDYGAIWLGMQDTLRRCFVAGVLNGLLAANARLELFANDLETGGTSANPTFIEGVRRARAQLAEVIWSGAGGALITYGEVANRLDLFYSEPENKRQSPDEAILLILAKRNVDAHRLSHSRQ